MTRVVVNKSVEFKGIQGLGDRLRVDTFLGPDLLQAETFTRHQLPSSVQRDFFLYLHGCSPTLNRQLTPTLLAELLTLGKSPGVSGLVIVHGQESTKIELKMPQQFVHTELFSFAISISPSGIHLLKMSLDSRPIEPEAYIDYPIPHLKPQSVPLQDWNSNVEFRKLGFSIKTPEIGHLRFLIPDTTQVNFHPTVGSEAIVNRGIWSIVAEAAKISAQIVAPDQTENKRPMGPSYHAVVNDRVDVFLQTETSRADRVFGVCAQYARPIRLSEWDQLTRGLHLDVEIGGQNSFDKARAVGIKASLNLNVWAGCKELDSLVEFICRLRSLG